MGFELDASGIKIELEISKKYVSINSCCDIMQKSNERSKVLWYTPVFDSIHSKKAL